MWRLCQEAEKDPARWRPWFRFPRSIAPANEPHILDAAWANPLELEPISPFLVPLVELQRSGWADVPIFFHMTHHVNAEGLWEPAPVAREMG